MTIIEGTVPETPAVGCPLQGMSETRWDVTIVGAGLAGGVAAYLLAQRGWRVLLLERAAWPREKTCGGCLNTTALAALEQMGLGSVCADAPVLERVLWHAGTQRLQLAAGGVAIDRSLLDARIVACCVERGATFLAGVSATVVPDGDPTAYRTLRLLSRGQTVTIQSALVLACDGINGSCLAEEPWAAWHIDRNAWMGVSTVYAPGIDDLPRGAIHMCIGRGGYVGLVRLTDQRVHLAAALAPKLCQRSGGPAVLIAQILQSSRKLVPRELREARWCGTGLLTRYRPVLGGLRVLVLGDACGYVEPFTGQGMAWAIQSSRTVVDLLPSPQAPWPEDLPRRWQHCHRATIGRQQIWCRALRAMIHQPALAAAGLALGRTLPRVGAFLANHIGGLNAPVALQGVKA